MSYSHALTVHLLKYLQLSYVVFFCWYSIHAAVNKIVERRSKLYVFQDPNSFEEKKRRFCYAHRSDLNFRGVISASTLSVPCFEEKVNA
jgi:hypothetical protein